MNTVQINPPDWQSALDDFSVSHEGAPVSVEVLSPELGAQTEIQGLPLLGVVAEPGKDGGVITVSAKTSDGSPVSHVIPSPSSVWLEKSDGGDDVAIQIESKDGVRTIIRSR